MKQYSVRELKRNLLEGEFKAKYGNDLEYSDLSKSKKELKRLNNAHEKSANEQNRMPMGNQRGFTLSNDGDFDAYYEDRANYSVKNRSVANGLTNIQGANDAYKRRVKTQMQGYVNEFDKQHREEEKENENLNYDTNKRWQREQEKIEKRVKANADYAKSTSLSMQDAKVNGMTKPKEVNESFNANKPIDTLTLKHTSFLTEGHAMSFIPESWKRDGKQFMLRDKNKNTYLVEWAGGPVILKHEDKTKTHQHIDRLKSLWEYKDDLNNTNTTANRGAEELVFKNMMDTCRGLKKS